MVAMATVMVLAACGGKAADSEGGAEESAMAPAAAPAETAAPAMAQGGTRHEVDMILEGANYVYRPAQLSIKPGDVVVFKAISGGMHNVQFWPDSLPAGAAAALEAGMTNVMAPLSSNLVAEGDSVVVSFAGAPAGRYPYFCLPHQALGMVAEITVAP
jgi:plastocyanin